MWPLIRETSPGPLAMLIEALSASSSISIIGSEMVSRPARRFSASSHSIRVRRTRAFFLTTNTTGWRRLRSGMPRLAAAAFRKSCCVLVKLEARCAPGSKPTP